MRTFKETPAQTHARYWFVLALFLVLMALAHGAAELKAWQDARAPVIAGVEHHTVDYYRVVFTIWVAIALLTPALCFHVFSRSDAPNSYWRAFWTVAYLSLLIHLYWAVFGVCHGDFSLIFDQARQAANPSECRVDHPKPDFFLAAWWGLDVLLAWLVTDNIKWVRVQRGALHMLATSMFFGAFVLAPKASITAHLLGIAMMLIVPVTFLLRLILRESDPKSLLTVLYVKLFQLLNLFVVPSIYLRFGRSAEPVLRTEPARVRVTAPVGVTAITAGPT